MNFLAIRQQIELRFDSSLDATVKPWVNQAEQEVWQAADWKFEHVPPTSISVVAARSSIGVAGDPFVLPTDFMEVERLFDDQGDRLRELPSDVFDDLYLPAILQSQSGTPEAFKVVNGVIYVGPAPSASKTYQMSYRRRLSTLTVGGATQVGPMSADTDTPIWRSDHHQVLVWGGMRIGMRTEADLAYIPVDDLYASALQAMVEDMAVEGSENREYGADDLGYSPRE